MGWALNMRGLYRAKCADALRCAGDFVADRSAELGDFFRPIIGGTYEGIRQGIYDRTGHYSEVTDRPHQSWEDYFSTFSA